MYFSIFVLNDRTRSSTKMIDCSFKRITSFVIVLYFFGCQVQCASTQATENQCPSSNKELIWRLDGHVIENNPGGNFDFCYTFADSATFYDITSVTVSPIPGVHSTKFTCTAETYPQCQASTLSLGFTRRCSRNARDFNFNINEDGVSMCENLNTTCETQLILQIETSTEAVTVAINSTSTRFKTSARLFNGFQRLQLHYQICMDDILTFQIPISADVPLDVSCYETTEASYLLDDTCLQDTTSTEDSFELTNAITSIDDTKTHTERPRAEKTRSSKKAPPLTKTTIYGIAGGGGGAVLVIIIISICCCVNKKKRKNKYNADDENPNVSADIMKSDEPRLSKAENLYQEVHLDDERKSTNITTAANYTKLLKKGSKDDLKSQPIHSAALEEPKQEEKMDALATVQEKETKLNDEEPIKLQSKDLELLYATPMKPETKMVDNDVYMSSGQSEVESLKPSNTNSEPVNEMPLTSNKDITSAADTMGTTFNTISSETNEMPKGEAVKVHSTTIKEDIPSETTQDETTVLSCNEAPTQSKEVEPVTTQDENNSLSSDEAPTQSKDFKPGTTQDDNNSPSTDEEPNQSKEVEPRNTQNTQNDSSTNDETTAQNKNVEPGTNQGETPTNSAAVGAPTNTIQSDSSNGVNKGEIDQEQEDAQNKQVPVSVETLPTP